MFGGMAVFEAEARRAFGSQAHIGVHSV
jgi:hypothetical protein